MKKNQLITGREIHNHTSQDTDTTSDYLDAFDAMMKNRTPEQAAEMARINAAAHCNQAIQAYQSEAAGMTAGICEVSA